MSAHREVIILSGLSGSGKSSALHTLEDAGYFAIDNLPGTLFPHLLKQLTRRSELGSMKKVALVMDAREGVFLKNFKHYFQILKSNRIRHQLIFFDARDEVLLRRFSETRRRHPLAPIDRASLGIQRERTLLHSLREMATHVVDTTELNVHELRQRILSLLKKGPARQRLSVTLFSFGYRHGLPLEADLIFDLRFLPNPHFVPALRPLTGRNPRVARFVLKQKVARRFLRILRTLLALLLGESLQEGKAYMNIGFGCTGGRHRSVVIAEEIAKNLKLLGYAVKIYHRDVKREE